VIEGELLDFIRSSIRSVWTLELLLLMRQQSRRAWPAAELVRETRSSDFVVSESLSTLQAAGLVTAESEGVYRYAPASPQFDRLVQQLEQVYRERPVAVTKAIFSSPNEKLQTFADAFKLKKD
jgi:hypothetical protein